MQFVHPRFLSTSTPDSGSNALLTIWISHSRVMILAEAGGSNADRTVIGKLRLSNS